MAGYIDKILVRQDGSKIKLKTGLKDGFAGTNAIDAAGNYSVTQATVNWQAIGTSLGYTYDSANDRWISAGGRTMQDDIHHYDFQNRNYTDVLGNSLAGFPSLTYLSDVSHFEEPSPSPYTVMRYSPFDCNDTTNMSCARYRSYSSGGIQTYGHTWAAMGAVSLLYEVRSKDYEMLDDATDILFDTATCAKRLGGPGCDCALNGSCSCIDSDGDTDCECIDFDGDYWTRLVARVCIGFRPGILNKTSRAFA